MSAAAASGPAAAAAQVVLAHWQTFLAFDFGAKRTGVARSPLRKGEKLKERVGAQLQAVADDPALVRSFFRHPSVAYISDL